MASRLNFFGALPVLVDGENYNELREPNPPQAFGNGPNHCAGADHPTAERTVGPARMFAGSLTPSLGIREQDRHFSEVAGQASDIGSSGQAGHRP
jgi:hypothetical protein